MMKGRDGESTRTRVSAAQRELLARLMAKEGFEPEAETQIKLRGEGAELHLSFAQQRLWLLHQIDGSSHNAYTVSTFYRLTGPLNVPALERAFGELVRRHEALRTTFTAEGGSPLQVISPPTVFRMEVVDLSELEEAAREEAARRLATLEEQRPFDLERGDLFRVKLLRLATDRHLLLVLMHHIISDGWSLGVLNQELGQLYEAYCREQPSPLADLPVQYADFALWQREHLKGEALEEQLSYWRRQLAGAPPILQLPLDRPRPKVQSFDGAYELLSLDESLTKTLHKLSREEHCTLYMLLLAAFAVLLARHCRETDVPIGSPIAGRSQPELEPLIGFFVNTLVLRVDCGGDPTFRQLLRKTREVCLGAYAHQDVPFEKLVEELEPERSLSHTPLFQVMFALQNAPQEELRLGETRFEWYASDIVTSKFDLMLLLRETARGLRGTLTYSKDLFEAETIRRMCGHWRTLLEGIAARPDARLSELPLLTADETRQLLGEWNPTPTPRPLDACVHQLFEAQAERTPEAVALVCEGEQTSYRELNERANRLAHQLRLNGVGPEDRVGILLERSTDMVVSMLAVLKAGGAYMPLDTAYPPQRIAFMLEDAAVKVLVTRGELLGELSPDHESFNLCLLDEARELLARGSALNPTNRTRPDNLAYVIYTSGSTGRPKGVAVSHASLLNLVVWHQRERCLKESDRATQFASPAFDASVLELWPPLCCGASVRFPDEETRLSPSALIRWLAEQSIDVCYLPTPLAEAVLREHWPAGMPLRALLTGGDKLGLVPPCNAEFELIDHYGPTECTVVATCAVVDRAGSGVKAPPIGRPIANTAAYLLDEHQRPVPVGVTGEMYLGGAGLARGYLGRPGLTAERFVPDPFSVEPGARLYRTGDFARFLPDGQIEYVGRADYQIKLRGFRIELGEIDAALRRHEAVAEAVVILDEAGGEKRLVAYVVAAGEARPATVELRQHLQQQLPPYMIPHTFVWLAEMPLTTSGKLDRRTLPAPPSGTEAEASEACRTLTPVEELVTGVWAEVLRLERVGPGDNFFELGGHSLLGMQVVSRLREALLVELPLRAIFEFPTVELLSEHLVACEAPRGRIEKVTGLPLLAREEGGVAAQPHSADEQLTQGAWALRANPIQPIPPGGELPLSILQEGGLLSTQWGQIHVLSAALAARSRLFYKGASAALGLAARLSNSRRRKGARGQRETVSPLLNRNRERLQRLVKRLAGFVMPEAVNSSRGKRLHIHVSSRWEGQLDEAALASALDEIVRRHHSLRAIFTFEGGRPVQRIRQEAKQPLTVLDLRALDDSEREAEVLRIISAEAERPFDFASETPLRVALLKLKDDEHILCVVIHHFVCDGVSLGIFNRELLALYQYFSRGVPAQLPELHIQYADFARWQREWLQGEVLERMLSFWDSHLNGVGIIPELELPFAGPRPAVTSYRGAAENLLLPEQLFRSLKRLARERKVTMYMLCLTALKVLLHRYTGREYIGVKTPFANRVRPEVRSIIGWLEHTMTLNTRISGDPCFTDLLAQVREECLGVYQYQEIPTSAIFAGLLSRQNNRDILLRQPRVPFVFFDFETRPAAQQIPGLNITPLHVPVVTALPGVAVTVIEHAERLRVHITYETDVHQAAGIQRMLKQFQTLLESIVANPAERISELSLEADAPARPQAQLTVDTPRG